VQRVQLVLKVKRENRVKRALKVNLEALEQRVKLECRDKMVKEV
jgi:hypothetical protein